MKELSAAVIALSGAVTIAAAGVWRGETGDLAIAAGYGLLLLGAVTWGTVFRRDDSGK